MWIGVAAVDVLGPHHWFVGVDAHAVNPALPFASESFVAERFWLGVIDKSVAAF
jgi:hypothetical protein